MVAANITNYYENYSKHKISMQENYNNFIK